MPPKRVEKKERVSHNNELDQAIQKHKYWVFICNHLLLLSALVGCSLSLYAYGVEKSIEKDKTHKAFCDINERISCTKVFSSPYGKGLGIFDESSIYYQPNSFFGIVYYTIICVFAFINSPVAVNGSLFLIITANLLSCYFAYILYFVLHDLCLVCIGTYVVNATGLVIITKKHKRVRLLNQLLEQQKSQSKTLKYKKNK